MSRRAPVNVAVVMGLLVFIVVLWVTEAAPLWITALLVPIVLVVSGAGTAKVALAPFFHPLIALFFGGFLIAEAMRRVKLDHLAAVSLVTWGGRSPVALFAAILGVSAFLSMWMSNTASTAVLLPIVLAVTAPLGSRAYTKVAVLGLAFAATIGGVGSAVGTPANPFAIEFLNDYAGRSISFLEWFAPRFVLRRMVRTSRRALSAMESSTRAVSSVEPSSMNTTVILPASYVCATTDSKARSR